jgi:L-ascorbate metabolism protein UlaG (beta-lactamase superfamily)
MSSQPHPQDGPSKKWHHRNFFAEVTIPSFFTRRAGKPHYHRPKFPEIKGDQIAITFIGHASFLIQTKDHNIIIDPNWANWLGFVKRLKHAGLHIQDLPPIDLVLITHAHFDHLSKSSLRKIARNQPIIVPEGVHDLVSNLGFSDVHQLKSWDEFKFKDITITCTPTKHWGARMLWDRHRGHGGYFIKIGNRSVYHCGDSAYFEDFKQVGEKLQPEIALMPIGAYDPPSGRDHHMNPEQALKAFQDVKAKIFIPMHWGTYPLSYEPFHDPPHRLMKEARKLEISKSIRFLNEGMTQVF